MGLSYARNCAFYTIIPLHTSFIQMLHCQTWRHTIIYWEFIINQAFSNIFYTIYRWYQQQLTFCSSCVNICGHWDQEKKPSNIQETKWLDLLVVSNFNPKVVIWYSGAHVLPELFAFLELTLNAIGLARLQGADTDSVEYGRVKALVLALMDKWIS